MGVLAQERSKKFKGAQFSSNCPLQQSQCSQEQKMGVEAVCWFCTFQLKL